MLSEGAEQIFLGSPNMTTLTRLVQIMLSSHMPLTLLSGVSFFGAMFRKERQ
jgi:hypothetical protein